VGRQKERKIIIICLGFGEITAEKLQSRSYRYNNAAFEISCYLFSDYYNNVSNADSKIKVEGVCKKQEKQNVPHVSNLKIIRNVYLILLYFDTSVCCSENGKHFIICLSIIVH
jgi:hypothetical protein